MCIRPPVIQKYFCLIMTNPYTYWNNLLSSPNFCHFSRTFLYTLQLFRHQGVGRSSPGEPGNTKRPIKNIGSFQRVMVISHRKGTKGTHQKRIKTMVLVELWNKKNLGLPRAITPSIFSAASSWVKGNLKPHDISKDLGKWWRHLHHMVVISNVWNFHCRHEIRITEHEPSAGLCPQFVQE